MVYIELASLLGKSAGLLIRSLIHSVSFHTPFSPGYCGSSPPVLSTAPGALTSLPLGSVIDTIWNGLTWIWKGWLTKPDCSVHSSAPPSLSTRSIRFGSYFCGLNCDGSKFFGSIDLLPTWN